MRAGSEATGLLSSGGGLLWEKDGLMLVTKLTALFFVAGRRPPPRLPVELPGVSGVGNRSVLYTRIGRLAVVAIMLIAQALTTIKNLRCRLADAL